MQSRPVRTKKCEPLSVLSPHPDASHPHTLLASEPPHTFHTQVRKAYKTYRLGGEISELLYSPAAYGLDMSIKNMPKSKGRIDAGMYNTLCIIYIILNTQCIVYIIQNT